MPPKRKANMPCVTAKKYAVAPILPEGEILEDFQRKRWRLGKSFATGGFGRIYYAKQLDSVAKGRYVIKMEPAENGPLFQEFHVYNRIFKPHMIESYKTAKGLDFLGVPAFYGAGLQERNGFKYRFLILPRFGSDLEKIRESQLNAKFSDETAVFRLALTCLNAYEYLHEHFYVHADLKAENLLLADDESTDIWNCYLVDYGLAKRIPEKPVYKEQPKKAHDGTLIFTSLDAHRGCAPSYRGDIEILAYNVAYWLSGALPWSTVVRASPEKVLNQKLKFSQNVRSELADIFGARWPYMDGMVRLFSYAYDLPYDRKPDFKQLRAIVNDMSNKAIARTKPTRIKNDVEKTRSPSKKRVAIVAQSMSVGDTSTNSDEDLFDPKPTKSKSGSTRPKYIPRVDETADSSTDVDDDDNNNNDNDERPVVEATSLRKRKPRVFEAPLDDLSSDDECRPRTSNARRKANAPGSAKFQGRQPSRKCNTDRPPPPLNRRLSTVEASLLKKYRNPKPTAGNLVSNSGRDSNRGSSNGATKPTTENGTQTSPALSERWLALRRNKPSS